jgi:hypothetical protein
MSHGQWRVIDEHITEAATTTELKVTRATNRIKRKMKSETKPLTVSEIISLGESGAVLTQSQIGSVLQVSPATMSRLVASKEIPFVVIQSGRRKKMVRFRWRDVERWLASRSRGPSRSNRNGAHRGDTARKFF